MGHAELGRPRGEGLEEGGEKKKKRKRWARLKGKKKGKKKKSLKHSKKYSAKQSQKEVLTKKIQPKGGRPNPAAKKSMISSHRAGKTTRATNKAHEKSTCWRVETKGGVGTKRYSGPEAWVAIRKKEREN